MWDIIAEEEKGKTVAAVAGDLQRLDAQTHKKNGEKDGKHALWQRKGYHSSLGTQALISIRVLSDPAGFSVYDPKAPR